MTDIELHDILAGIERHRAATDQRIDEARKQRAEESRTGPARERPILAMAMGAALFAVGAVLGGLLVR